jgi:hypothetical protein
MKWDVMKALLDAGNTAGIVAAVTRLTDPDVPLGPMARLLLVLSLATRDPAASAMGVDAAIAAIEDGRLDAASLGAQMAELLRHEGLLVAGRLAKTLAACVRGGPLHAAVIRRAIELSLRGGPGKMPRDMQTLLQLLHELCVEQAEAVEDVGSRAFLERIGGTGKTARLAKTILALTPDDPARRRNRTAVATTAIEGRIRHADGWQCCSEDGRPSK